MVLVGLFFVCESGRSPCGTWSCGEKAIGVEQLAEKINVSDKTVSKWETAKGILFYCNQDGLFSINIVKGIDDKVTSYLVLWEPKTESRKIIIF